MKSTIPDNERLAPGLRAQQVHLHAGLARGEEQAGWKLGFGSPTAQANLELSAPLTGYLLTSARVDSGSHVSVSGWIKPIAEAEVAVRMCRDLAADAHGDEVIAAVGAFLPAIELADADLPFTDPAPILAGDIFQRHYVLGAPVTRGWGDGPEHLRGLVHVHESEHRVTDTQELTGLVVDNLTHLALVAQVYGRGLRANDIVLLGSVVPPVPLNVGDAFTFELSNQDVASTVSVTVT